MAVSGDNLDPGALLEIARDRFGFLATDFALEPVESPIGGGLTLVYEGRHRHHAVRVVIAADGRSFDVEVVALDAAPLAPVVTLDDIVAMRAPGTEPPERVVRSRHEGLAALSRSGELLRQLADDALWGGWGLFEDFVHWKRGAPGVPGVDWWVTPPLDDPRFGRGRTKDEIRLDREYQPIHGRLQRDPEEAWPDVVEFVRKHPASLDASDLVEDLMFEHGERFIDRIEDLARTDAAFRSTVEFVHLGGIAGPAIDRFHQLQDEIHAGKSRDDQAHLWSVDPPSVVTPRPSSASTTEAVEGRGVAPLEVADSADN